MQQLFTALVEFVEQHEVLLSALASGAVLLGILSRIRRRLWRLIRAGGTKILAMFRRSDRPVARNLKELLRQIKPLLDDNGRIFRDFAPNSGSGGTGPIRGREKLALWQDLKIRAVVPNNANIRRMIEINQHVIPSKYQPLFTRMQSHIDAFEIHCKDPSVSYEEHQFPIEFAALVKEYTS